MTFSRSRCLLDDALTIQFNHTTTLCSQAALMASHHEISCILPLQLTLYQKVLHINCYVPSAGRNVRYGPREAEETIIAIHHSKHP